eukprot:1732648-Rhodomonas_salina.1
MGRDAACHGHGACGADELQLVLRLRSCGGSEEARRGVGGREEGKRGKGRRKQGCEGGQRRQQGCEGGSGEMKKENLDAFRVPEGGIQISCADDCGNIKIAVAVGVDPKCASYSLLDTSHPTFAAHQSAFSAHQSNHLPYSEGTVSSRARSGAPRVVGPRVQSKNRAGASEHHL